MTRILTIFLLSAICFGCAKHEAPLPVADTNKITAVSLPDSGLIKALARHQCEAITKKGTRCKRTVAGDQKYCWQHAR